MPRRKSGFTLIELMITISVMAIVTISLIPALRSFDRKNRLEIASQELKTVLQQARTMAMSPRVEDSGAKIYAVRIRDVSQPQYELGYWKIANLLPAGGYDSQWKAISSRKLANGVSIDVSNTCPNYNLGLYGPEILAEFTIGFKVPTGEPQFDLIYDQNNRASGTGCASGSPLWTSVGGKGEIILIDGANPNKTVIINSVTGQIAVE